MSASKLDAAIGRRIKAWRAERGLTQEQLSGKIDISVDTISNLERGAASTRISTIERICKGLEIDPSELFGDRLPPRRAHPLIEELAAILEYSDPTVLQAVLDQTRTLLRALDSAGPGNQTG